MGGESHHAAWLLGNDRMTKTATVESFNRRGSRHKGEKTRQKILAATMAVIAREGVRGTTHRAVAAEAGVQLSLTTYYFKNLGELISEAFRMFMERDREDMAERWQKAFRYLDRYDRAGMAEPANQKRIIEYMSQRIINHIREKLEHLPEGLAVEHHFFFEAMLDTELKELVEVHRQRLLDPVVRFCRYFNARSPEVDAELLLGTITRLEYESLLLEPEAIDYRSIRRQVRRIVGWVVTKP